LIILKMSLTKKKIVIIGAGPGGINVAQKLDDSKFDLTVIERQSKFFYNIASPRGSVEPAIVDKLFIPFENALKNGKIIHAEVKEIGKDSVVATKLDGSSEQLTIGYDYLVIATGSSYSFPIKVQYNIPENESKNQLREISAKIKEAKSILIIGGGVVGCELAGEIKTDYPDKNVTIVHSADKLVKSPLPLEFSTKIYHKLTKELKVEVFLNERIIIETNSQNQEENKEVEQNQNEFDGMKHQILKTDKGREIESDLQFVCTGTKINNSLLNNNELFSSHLDEEGRLKVNNYLQVEGFENVYCLGDVSNAHVLKTSYMATLQSACVADNIKLNESGKSLKPYNQGKLLMAVSLGRRNGVSNLPGLGVVGGTITTMIKSKGLFINKIWSTLNAKMPK